MADAADETFEQAGSGASTTYPKQCSGLRKNEYCILKGRPCKIVEMSTSKTGKHGHAKVHMVGLDIFTNKKYEDICPSTHNMNVPVVSRIEYQLNDIQDDDYLDMMDDKNEPRCDLKLPDSDVGREIRAKFSAGENLNVTVLKAMNEEVVVGVKTGKE